MKLTKEFIKELKSARTMTASVNGSRSLRLHFETRCKVTGELLQSCKEYPVESGDMGICYGAHEKYPVAHAHVWLTYSGAAQAFKLLVREGDEVTFQFRENSNGYVDAASIQRGALKDSPYDAYDRIYRDEFCVSIRRNGKTVLDSLPIEQSICPDNSARMLQRY